MWKPLLQPGLTLLHGQRRELREFHQEIAHFTLHAQKGPVLWCDGDHGFDPSDFAELNLTRGRQADDGAGRLLIKRCMTPFQWDSVLTLHLEAKLAEMDASLVLCAPYDRLFSTDELTDWEQEDYVRYSLDHLKNLAMKRHVPIVLTVDMHRWWQSHPLLARMTYETAERRWSIRRTQTGWCAVQDGTDLEIVATTRQITTLDDFLPVPEPVKPSPPRLRASARPQTESPGNTPIHT